MSREIRQLARAVQALGWRVELTRGGHVRWSPPDGSRFIISPSTPSSTRSILNLVADLRRAGLALPR